MWHSVITYSLDYTFISFESIAYYERDRFTGALRQAQGDSTHVHPTLSCEVVTGNTREACFRKLKFSPASHAGECSSLGIARERFTGFTDMSNEFAARSLERRAQN